MTRAAPTLMVLALPACTTEPADSNGAARIAAVFDGSAGTWVDLTHAFSEESVYWPTDGGRARIVRALHPPRAEGSG